MPRASDSNYSAPHQRKELPYVSQGKDPRRQGVKAGKKPRGSSNQDIHWQNTVGEANRPEQGETKKKGRGHQVTGKAKIWKNVKGCFKRDIPDRSKTREEKKGQETYKRPNTRTSGKPGQGETKRTRFPDSPYFRRTQEEQSTLPKREPADSRTSPTPKDKKDTQIMEAPQEDAGSQTSRQEPQTQGSPRAKQEEHACKSKDKDKRTIPCQSVSGSTSTPTGKGAHPRDQDDTTPPQGGEMERRPAPRRTRQANVQNPA